MLVVADCLVDRLRSDECRENAGRDWQHLMCHPSVVQAEVSPAFLDAPALLLCREGFVEHNLSLLAHQDRPAPGVPVLGECGRQVPWGLKATAKDGVRSKGEGAVRIPWILDLSQGEGRME